MKTFRKVLDKILEYLCSLLLVLMTCTATWQVVSRYIFKNPSTWSESVTLIAFVWMALFASAYVFGKQEHMKMTFILDKFNCKNRKRIEIITEIIIFTFSLCILVIGGFKISMLEMGQREASLGVPMGYIYLALPLSGIVTCIYNVMNLIEKATSSSKADREVSKKTA